LLAKDRLLQASRWHGPGPSPDAPTDTVIKNKEGATKTGIKNKLGSIKNIFDRKNAGVWKTVLP
jgi:hypothetical protein